MSAAIHFAMLPGAQILAGALVVALALFSPVVAAAIEEVRRAA